MRTGDKYNYSKKDYMTINVKEFIKNKDLNFTQEQIDEDMKDCLSEVPIENSIKKKSMRMSD